MHLRALVEQLQKRMLAVRAGLSPNDRTCVPCNLLAVSSNGFPIALHVRLLKVCWQSAQIFGVRQDDMRPMPQKVLIPVAQKRQQNGQVVLKWCLFKMPVDTPCACQKVQESLRAEGHGNAQSNRPPHGIAPSNPILKTESLRIRHAECPGPFQVGGHRSHLCFRVPSPSNQPILGNGRIRHGFLCREGLAHHHEHGGPRIQSRKDSFSMGAIHIADEVTLRSFRVTTQRLDRHGGAQIRSPNANVDHICDGPLTARGMRAVHKSKHSLPNVKHAAHDIFAIHSEDVTLVCTQGHVQDRPAFRRIQLHTAKQVANRPFHVRLSRQIEQALQDLKVPFLFGHVDEQTIKGP